MPYLALSRAVALGLVALAIAPVALAQAATDPCRAAGAAMPQRPAGARGGSEVLDALAGADDRERERALRRELLSGNLPGFLRRALPLTQSARLADGRSVRLTLCVLPDYLGIGSDDDHGSVPMGLPTALEVAARFGFTLPTRRIVDLIYRHAALRLAPRPLPPDDRMRSAETIRHHNALVQAQRDAAGAAPGVLTAGHKKDLVLGARLDAAPGRVAIYGWHRAPGAPIQPLSTAHGALYADYSHGVRLVGTVVFVDGAPRSIFDVLADAQLAPLLSDEGPLPQAQRFGSDLQQRNPRW